MEDTMTFKKTLLIASMVLGLAACGPDGGQSSIDAGACVAADAGQGASQFLGAWQPIAGTTTCTCSNGSTFTNPSDSTDTSNISSGCSSEAIVITDSATGCSETCDVVGTTATCHPTTCTVDGATLKTSSDVYTLTGGEIRETGSGTESLSNGTSCQCATTDDAYVRTP
jgi:hypothetical protein